MKAAMLVMSIAFVTNVGVSSAGPLPAPAVSVRTYNYAAVPAATLLAGRSEANQIFRSAGIPLAWIDCRVPGSEDGRACIEPLLPGRDLILRLVDRMPAGDARLVALGESMLDREARGGVLMTIDTFPIRAVAERASSPAATLLGRAIAHEIGHLLLGSGGHPRIGLMRALWSQEELRGLRPAHWGFSPREAARMRQKLLAKSRTADGRGLAYTRAYVPHEMRVGGSYGACGIDAASGAEPDWRRRPGRNGIDDSRGHCAGGDGGHRDDRCASDVDNRDR